jgi:type IV secretory pathway TrbD component
MTVTDYIPRLPASRILRRDNLVTGIKWGASLVQIAGYTATAMGFTPLNIYLFLIGLVGWFAVGVFWRDRAIMLIHVVALGAMLVGLAGS